MPSGAHELLEQLYTEINRVSVSRAGLLSVANRLTDIITPLVAVAATPALDTPFRHEELNAVLDRLTPTMRAILRELERYYGQPVRLERIIAVMRAAQPPGKREASAKVLDVQLAKMRGILASTPYQIRTSSGARALVPAAEAPSYSGAFVVRQGAPTRYSDTFWRGGYVPRHAALIGRYFEAHAGECIEKPTLLADLEAIGIGRKEFNARLTFLRGIAHRLGYRIESKFTRQDGKITGWYRFEEEPNAQVTR